MISNSVGIELIKLVLLCWVRLVMLVVSVAVGTLTKLATFANEEYCAFKICPCLS